jgi:hypothetical protein
MKRLPVVRLEHARIRRPWLSWSMFALAGAACVCTLLLTHAVDLVRRAALLEDRLQEAERMHAGELRMRAAPPSAFSSALRLAEEKAREEMSRPWARLFGAIEQASGPDVSLLSMAPVGARAEVTVGGEARSMGALLGFMRKLRDGGFFTQVYLRDHHIDPGDPLQPVHFSVHLKWRTP